MISSTRVGVYTPSQLVGMKVRTSNQSDRTLDRVLRQAPGASNMLGSFWLLDHGELEGAVREAPEK